MEVRIEHDDDDDIDEEESKSYEECDEDVLVVPVVCQGGEGDVTEATEHTWTVSSSSYLKNIISIKIYILILYSEL